MLCAGSAGCGKRSGFAQLLSNLRVAGGFCLYGGGEQRRGSRCGSRTVFASRGADSRRKRRRWRPGEELGCSSGCECSPEGGTKPWPWDPGKGGASVEGTVGKESMLPSQGQAKVGRGTAWSILTNVSAATWGETCGWGSWPGNLSITQAFPEGQGRHRSAFLRVHSASA